MFAAGQRVITNLLRKLGVKQPSKATEEALRWLPLLLRLGVFAAWHFLHPSYLGMLWMFDCNLVHTSVCALLASQFRVNCVPWLFYWWAGTQIFLPILGVILKLTKSYFEKSSVPGLTRAAEGHLRQNPLMAAILENNPQRVRQALAGEACPDTIPLMGSPLGAALAMKRISCARVMLDAGANINFMDTEATMTLTPISCAIEGGCMEGLRMLLEAGAKVNPPFPATPPIAMAATHNQVGMARVLVRAGAQLEMQDLRGHTAMHEAARKGHTGMVRFLLQNGANVNSRTWQGFTPLDLAKSTKNDNVVTVLKRHGAVSSMLQLLPVLIRQSAEATARMEAIQTRIRNEGVRAFADRYEDLTFMRNLGNSL